MSIQWVGIDISKDWFDAHTEGRDKRFSNRRMGFEELIAWLGEGNFHVVLEATGGHERALRRFLDEAGIPASVAHAFQVHSFGKALGRLHKTDKVDARLLCEFGKMRMPRPSVLDKEHRRDLKRLVSTWKSLQGQLVALQAQLRSPETPEIARKGLEAAENGLDLAMMDVMTGIEKLIGSHADLSQDVSLLTSIKGVGTVSAVQILAQLPEGELRSARQLAAYAGTAPGIRESGSSVRGASRIPRSCNHRLRSVLYMCALVARRYCPHLRAFGDRLAERGKSKKQVIVAVMRKLTHAIHGVLTTRMSYDGAKLCPGA
jgi:transposase